MSEIQETIIIESEAKSDLGSGGVRSIAGITDPEWLDWFDAITAADKAADIARVNAADSAGDPWIDWLKYQRFPRANPLIAWLEHDVKDLTKAADILRQSTAPQTETFKAQYETFRKMHAIGGPVRYMVWRAAALKAICERDRFQDCIDRRQARDTLLATMQFFGPLDVDGKCKCGSNFWRPIEAPNKYAAMVLLLMRQAIKSPGIMLAASLWSPEHPIPTGFNDDTEWTFRGDRWMPKERV